MSLADISDGKTVEADQILGLLIAILQEQSWEWNFTENVLWKQQERRMAFKKTMAPIRILIVLCSWYGNPPCFSDFTEPSALGTL